MSKGERVRLQSSPRRFDPHIHDSPPRGIIPASEVQNGYDQTNW